MSIKSGREYVKVCAQCWLQDGAQEGELGGGGHCVARLLPSHLLWVSSGHQPTLSDKEESRDWENSFLNRDLLAHRRTEPPPSLESSPQPSPFSG